MGLEWPRSAQTERLRQGCGGSASLGTLRKSAPRLVLVPRNAAGICGWRISRPIYFRHAPICAIPMAVHRPRNSEVQALINANPRRLHITRKPRRVLAHSCTPTSQDIGTSASQAAQASSCAACWHTRASTAGVIAALPLPWPKQRRRCAPHWIATAPTSASAHIGRTDAAALPATQARRR